MNQQVKTGLGVLIIVIMALTIGALSWIFYKNNISDEIAEVKPPFFALPKACTEEAKACPDGETYVSRTGKNCEFAPCPETVGIENKLVVLSPKLDEAITSPVSISGRAVGGWFFEGSFPVSIEDEKGRVLGKGIAEFVPSYPDEEWMTEGFVNFQAKLKFSVPSVAAGTIIFSKDNPSGNPALDETFRLPVKFGKGNSISDWQTYRNEKYGFEFKYPKDWIIKLGGGINYDSALVSVASAETLKEIKSAKTSGLSDDISVYYYSSIADEPEIKGIDPRVVALDEMIKKNEMISKIGKVLIDGNEAIDVIWGGEGTYYAVLIEKNKHLYKIFFNNISEKNELTDAEKQILSTFKFTK